MVKEKILESINNLQHMLENEKTIETIYESVSAIVNAIKAGNKLMICGNGGSAADAQHVAGEFVCRFYKDRKPLPAISLSTETSVLTAISNDYAYDDIFSRQVETFG